jgi:hypothetical protein
MKDRFILASLVDSGPQRLPRSGRRHVTCTSRLDVAHFLYV